MDFNYPWSEFCLLETYFKTKVANLVHDDMGQPLNVSQIYLNNFGENCPPKNNVDKASLKFYIIKPGGTCEGDDKNMTIKAFKILHYLVENKLGALFGQLFQLKIEKVEAKGEDAPPKPTGFTEIERTYIAIGIAVGILAIIVCITIVVYLVKNRKKGDNNNAHKHANEYIGEENKLEIVQPHAPVNADPPQEASETKF